MIDWTEIKQVIDAIEDELGAAPNATLRGTLSTREQAVAWFESRGIDIGAIEDVAKEYAQGQLRMVAAGEAHPIEGFGRIWVSAFQIGWQLRETFGEKG